MQSLRAFDLQTGLTVARVNAQVLKLAHIHVDVYVMRSGECGGTRPLEL